MPRLRNTQYASRWRLILIIFLYLLFSVTYSIIVPIGRGADEWAHYWYAQFIAQNGRLPATLAERETAGYKSDWPPLYHLLAAGLTAWIDTAGPPTFKYRAGSLRRQLIPAQGSEAILHTRDEQFPWQQEILVWRLGRFLSLAFSAGTLIVTYFIALEFFARKRKTDAPYVLRQIPPETIAVICVAFLAFNPRFLFTGMLFNYDGLTLLLASLFLWLGIRIAKGYYPNRGFWFLGALAGLALVTKYLTILLPLEILIITIYLKNTQPCPERSRRDTTRNSSSFSHLTSHISHSPSPILKPVLQAALPYLLITGLWFGYLIITFNEIETYGPVLGTLAPLIRGDGSDRTVEQIFAWISGGQAPPPAYIQKQSYTAWQIITELPATFWANPVVRPFPLNWFVRATSLFTAIAALGLALFWWGVRGNRFWINLLLLHCALPLPFMIVRLFGARDALEAVQGRHILFLAAPAVAVLFVLGWWSAARVLSNVLRVFPFLLYLAPYMVRGALLALLGLLGTGAVAQLIFMADVYATLLPVQTTPYAATSHSDVPAITLGGGATLLDYQLEPLDQSIQVTLIWQSGDAFAPEDYQTELQLLTEAGQPVAGWQAYQTQARYPTRAWEPGDIIYDVGWLPVAHLPAGDYQVQVRIWGKDGPVTAWHTLGKAEGGRLILSNVEGMKDEVPADWIVWRNGQSARKLTTFNERKTVQITLPNPKSKTKNLKLTGPDDIPRDAVSSGPGWVNFIIQPDWPAGQYRLSGVGTVQPVLRVAGSNRNFQMPSMSHPLDVDFEGRIKLLGYDLPARRVEPGGGLPVTLYWRAQEWPGEDFVIFNRLLDNQQVAFGGYDRLPKEHYSTLLWAPGEIVTDGFAVPIAPDAPDGVYTLNLGLYRRADGSAESLQIMNPETSESTGSTSVTIGPIKVGGPPAGVTIAQAAPQTELNVVLGDKVKLLGFDGSPDEAVIVDKSSALELTLYWQTLNQIEIDYTVFVHIRNAAGETVAQKDGPPVNGAYPTNLWDTGEIIRDEIILPMDQLEPGRYELVVGLYNPLTAIRLPVDESLDNAILLGTFQVIAE